jgi:hypothetical protein
MSIDVTKKLQRERPRIDPARDAARGGQDLSVLVGLAAVVFSAVYFLSDLIELASMGSRTRNSFSPMSRRPQSRSSSSGSTRCSVRESSGSVSSARSCMRTPSSSSRAR